MNTIADELGTIAAQIAALTERQDALKKELIEAGVTAAEGDLFRVTVSEVFPSARVDWATIAQRLGASRQLIAAHSSPSKSFHRVSVKARTAEVAHG